MNIQIGRDVFLGVALVAAAAVFSGGCRTCRPDEPVTDESGLLCASYAHLPRWRGFNLLEKFYRKSGERNEPFQEEDFRLISQLGFNFVRLPMDYRTWIVDGDWTRFDEKTLAEIDQAVEWGGAYGIHVCINFHRAPGYTVAKPPEARDLWTDAEAQRVCALHWAAFARRYRGIPNSRLSFNLFNEPTDIEPEAYAHVVGLMAKAIRAEDPDRLIIADGLRWGQEPCDDLIPLHVAQATRGYSPHELTHYKASWISNGDKMVPPQWPLPLGNCFLYGAGHEFHSPMVIRGSFDGALAGRVRVGTVSSRSRIVVKAGGRTLLDEPFVSSRDPKSCEKVVYRKEWDCYQNVFNRDLTFTVPAGCNDVTIENVEGDWMTVPEIGFRPVDAPVEREDVLRLPQSWGQKQSDIRYLPQDHAGPFRTEAMIDGQYLWDHYVQPWYDLKQRGIGVIVGEWGAFNKTPHDVVLRWMEDCLKNWNRADMGWALWNFRGSFGVLDSGRDDVAYADWEGHKVDREMLDLLRRY